MNTYTWDPRTAQYRNARGQFVSRRAVREELDKALDAQAAKARALAERLRNSRRTPADIAAFRRGMVEVVRNTTTYSAAIAKGGWAQMTPADWGHVGQRVKEQLAYLRNFEDQLRHGRLVDGKRIPLPLDGRFDVRSAMYAQSGRGAYDEVQRREFIAVGQVMARRSTAGGDSCPGCVEQEMKGWVYIEELAPLDSQQCLSACKCSLEARAPTPAEFEALRQAGHI